MRIARPRHRIVDPAAGRARQFPRLIQSGARLAPGCRAPDTDTSLGTLPPVKVGLPAPDAPDHTVKVVAEVVHWLAPDGLAAALGPARPHALRTAESPSSAHAASSFQL
jgi:hypothetical protein